MHNSTKTEQLVSIIVITYNSSKYVLETLESIRSQTYQNIELIISDDCSTDNTVEICEEWLRKHTERFQEVKIITTPQNTGIPANCNRGVNVSKGDWIKMIAGDDLLSRNCIDEFQNYISIHKDCKAVACDMLVMENQVITTKWRIDRYLIKGSSKRQLKMLCRFNFIVPAPGLFLHRHTLLELGGYDEEYRMVEDFPFLLKLLFNGYKVDHLQNELVIYRIHNDSVTRTAIKQKTNIYDDFFDQALYPLLKKKDFFLWRHYKLLGKLNKCSNKIKRTLLSTTIRISDPYYFYFNYHKIICKRSKWKTIREESIA